MDEPFVIDGIDHVEVFVTDLDAAAAWYARTLGLKLVHKWDGGPYFIGAYGAHLALFPIVGANAGLDPAAARGWYRVAWRVTPERFEAAQRWLRELSIPFRGPIDHDIAWSIYFKDPDGNLLEITCAQTD
ncbi:MAG: VOC family protein [Phycisphaerales bacterium]